MQTAQPAARWRAFRPSTGWLALIVAGIVASVAGAVFPSAPSSDAWLPYELRLHASAATNGRIALWWKRHVGYVTSPGATQRLSATGGLAEIRVASPAGLIVGTLLQLSPAETRMNPVATVGRQGQVAAVLDFRNARPLHETCDLTWENDVLVIRPRTTARDMEIELLLRPAVNLPVPRDADPPHLATVVRRERVLGFALAVFGLGMLVLIRLLDRPRDGTWSSRAMIRGAIVTYSALAVVFARRPDVFALPQFWAEDGSVFFLEQHQQGLGAVFQPYAGYLHLWPRLIAAIAGGFPAASGPMIYLFGAVFALIWCVWRTASPRTGLAAPAICALALVLVPRMGELVLSVTNAQWFGAVALLALALGRPPVSRSEHVGDVVTIIVFGLTGPFGLLLLPVFLVRAWRDRDASAGVALLLVGMTAVVQAWFFAQQAAVAVASPAAAETHTKLQPLLAATGLRTGGEFLGLANRIPEHLEWWIGAVMLGGWILLWRLPGRVGPRGTTLMLGWAAFAVLAGGLVRFRGYPEELFLPTHAQRYFHLPFLVTIWLLIAGLMRAAGWRRIACGACLGLWIVQLALSFRITPLVDFQWRDRLRTALPDQPVTIPINPSPWAVILPAAPAAEKNAIDFSRSH